MNVYFDNSATTKPSREVLSSFFHVQEQFYGNPSSLHHLGVEAEKLMEKSRAVCAEQLGVKGSELIFTSGGTESNNLALKGIALGYKHRGKHIITTQVEHPSVYDACKDLEATFGFEVTYLPVDQYGVVSVDELEKSIRQDTILVSIMHVNNELGSIQPIQQIGDILKEYPSIFFHVDQVQGIGKVPLSIKRASIDLLTLSGHKLHAPKGIGLLYVNERIKQFYSLFHGGSQQSNKRAGTENVAGAVAFAKALRLALEEEGEVVKHLSFLKQECLKGLQELEGVVSLTQINECFAPHIINVAFLGIKPEVLVHTLEEQGIYVSTKSACSSKSDLPSRILLATGLKEEVTKYALRISFSKDNTLEEVTYFNQKIKEIIPYYHKILKV
ncbi:cysteine desulfurase family protein [Bacillus horti]|uniref:Cysteine desulfurase n=1 Tax=Caldalkalibacillus horti TaxID=77523 RepID=A0ABT9W4R1_9BACI|nr:cysteine desulfurase family protein [Bacillus horti]MDQ0168110.1 cysteine desulfurase [Bacillus horti]